MIERTLAVIKPCSVRQKDTGDIISAIEQQGFDIAEMSMTHYTVKQAEEFYREHVGKDFYPELIKHTISGPVVCLILEGEGVVEKWRKAMGPTDPSNGCGLRSIFGTGLPTNSLHGSATPEDAEREISLMFWVHDAVPNEDWWDEATIKHLGLDE